MSKSSDPQKFFETDADVAKRERRDAKSSNKFGNPVALKSKILAAIPDPKSPSCIFVAESAATVRRVDINDGSVKAVYRGPTAPVTCLTISPDGKTVFAGSWDKNIWSWDISSSAPGKKLIGHSDFVKAIVCTRLAGKNILISGGADKKIMVWDLDSGKRLHTLQDSVQNMLAVQDLVVDPVQSTADEAYLFSAGSDPFIRRWKVRADGWEQVTETAADGNEKRTIDEHETTVYKLVFDIDGDEVDLWTCSGDGTVKCLARGKSFTNEDTITHGNHVRAVAVTDTWVITAGRDEDLKVWDRVSGKLYASLEGHYDEVTDLALIKSSSGHGSRLASVSIDGTIRTWSLAKAEVDAHVEEQQKVALGQADEAEETEGLMTADEEAELAALMEDD